jgi:hypothetical protein
VVLKPSAGTGRVLETASTEAYDWQAGRYPLSDPLVTYLEDHKAGAGLAIGLLQAMKARHDDQSLSQFAGSILVGIEEDEETLRILAQKIGTGSNILKEAAAWVGEKASRVKLGAGSSGDFGTFEALEFLSLGIQGKLSLWHALQVVAVSDDRLRGLDFKTLISRAETQYAKVEERRLALATTAFGQPKS